MRGPRFGWLRGQQGRLHKSLLSHLAVGHGLFWHGVAVCGGPLGGRADACVGERSDFLSAASPSHGPCCPTLEAGRAMLCPCSGFWSLAAAGLCRWWRRTTGAWRWHAACRYCPVAAAAQWSGGVTRMCCSPTHGSAPQTHNLCWTLPGETRKKETVSHIGHDWFWFTGGPLKDTDSNNTLSHWQP